MIAQIPFEDTRKTGYKFGQKIQKQHAPDNTYHPGIDANQGKDGGADEGMPVKALAKGRVVYAKNAGAGWGNLIVIEHPELSKLWPTGYIASRYAHLKNLPLTVGQEVTMDDMVGLCGKTGTGSPHVHWEVIQRKLPSYTHYPNGKGYFYVCEHWLSPEWFVKEVNRIYAEKPKDPEWFDRKFWEGLVDVDGYVADPSPYKTLEVIRKAVTRQNG